jgi:hypothetical protein
MYKKALENYNRSLALYISSVGEEHTDSVQACPPLPNPCTWVEGGKLVLGTPPSSMSLRVDPLSAAHSQS